MRTIVATGAPMLLPAGGVGMAHAGEAGGHGQVRGDRDGARAVPLIPERETS